MFDEMVNKLLLDAMRQCDMTVQQMAHVQLSESRVFWSLWINSNLSNVQLVQNVVNQAVARFGSVYGVWDWSPGQYYITVTVYTARALMTAIHTNAVPSERRLS